ncbi:MAG: hypothetical protein ACLS3C_11835 [Oscillospiraceae bacterium]
MLRSEITLEPLLDQLPDRPYSAILGRIDYPEQQAQPLVYAQLPALRQCADRRQRRLRQRARSCRRSSIRSASGRRRSF